MFDLKFTIHIKPIIQIWRGNIQHSSCSETEIPIVNIEPWTRFSFYSENDRLDVAKAWDNAFSNFGFAIITGHGVSSDDFCQLEKESRIFFEEPLEQKKAQSFSEIYGHPSGGYTAMGTESVARSVAGDSKILPDGVESFVFTNHPKLHQSPNGLPLHHFHSAQKYFETMESLTHVLHRISSAALQLDDLEYFRKFYVSEPSSVGESRESFGTLRLAYYPPIHTQSHISTSDRSGKEQSRYGAHTDYQGYTILSPDARDWEESGSGGLEVQVTTGSNCTTWIPVKLSHHHHYTHTRNRSVSVFVSEDTVGSESQYERPLVVNAGDLIQRWTNDRWKSAVHMVSKPQHGSLTATHPRVSLVFFTGPVNNALISTLPLPDQVQGTSKYPPIGSKDHLLLKLKRSNVGGVTDNEL
eukprot:gene7700-15758_t